jgi:hypothetical protein
LRHLAPGGFLLVTTNERRRRGRLRDAVLAAARRAAVLVTVGAANPSLDFPSLRGFPEGDAFEGVVAERREALASGL